MVEEVRGIEALVWSCRRPAAKCESGVVGRVFGMSDFEIRDES